MQTSPSINTDNSVFNLSTLSSAVGEIPIVKKTPSEYKNLLSEISSTSQEGESILYKLRKIRDKALQSIADKDFKFDDYVSIFIAAWELISSIEAKSTIIRLPVFFKSDVIIEIIRKILSPIWIMGRYFHNLSVHVVGTGSSVLITGPVGVGKTTLMVVMNVLCILLTDHVIPVYYEYTIDQQHLLPLDLIYQVTEILCDFHSFKDVGETILTTLYRNNKICIFFADEIQTLYKQNNTSNHYKEIIDQIARLGKNSHHMAVATGSSVNTAKFAFYPDRFGFCGYTTLNNSVFVESPLQPIRNRTEFTYLAAIYDVIDDSEVIDLFLKSGGIGRRLDQFKYNRNKNDSLLLIPDAYDVDMAFQAIVNEMVMNVRSYLDSNTFDPWTVSHGLSRYRVLELIQIYDNIVISESEASVILSSYYESSYLLPIAGNVELVVPGIIWEVYLKRQFNETDRLERMAIEGTLSGWSDVCSHSSAGHAVEEFIRRMIAYNDNNCYYNKDEIFNCKDDLIPLDYYCNRWIQGVSSNFTGIDGFKLTKETIDNNNDIYKLHVTQIKTGRINLKIKKGYIYSEGTAVYIFDKMKNGINKILKCFEINSSNSILLESFIFASTNDLEEDAADYLYQNCKNMNCNFIFIDSDVILEGSGLPSIIKKRLSKWKSKC